MSGIFITDRSVAASDFLPSADDTYDVGSSSAEWKDGYFDGTLHADTIEAVDYGLAAADLPAHTHVAANQGGDYPWADFLAADVTLVQAITATAAELNLLDLAGLTAGQLLVATGAAAAAWQSTGVKLSAPDISGTVTAAAALTLPAFTLGGTVTLNGQILSGVIDHNPVALSGNAPLLVGAWFSQAAQTFTDTQTAEAGTVATGVFNSWGIPTYDTDKNDITVTDLAAHYFAGPPALGAGAGGGAGVAGTRLWTLWVGAGNIRLEGHLMLGGSNQGIYWDKTTGASNRLTVSGDDLTLRGWRNLDLSSGTGYNLALQINGADKWALMNTTFAFAAQADALAIAASNTDAHVLNFQARNSGVGLANVMSLIGAADPYVGITGVMATIPTNANLPIGWWTIGYVSGGNATLYCNDGGTIKSLVLGAPA